MNNRGSKIDKISKFNRSYLLMFNLLFRQVTDDIVTNAASVVHGLFIHDSSTNYV